MQATGNLNRTATDCFDRESGLFGRDPFRGRRACCSALVHLSARLELAELGIADQSALEKTRESWTEYCDLRHALDHLVDVAGGLSDGSGLSDLPRRVRPQESLDSHVANQHLESGGRPFRGVRIVGARNIRAVARFGSGCPGGCAHDGALEPAGNHHFKPGSVEGDPLVPSGSGIWRWSNPMAGNRVPCAASSSAGHFDRGHSGGVARNWRNGAFARRWSGRIRNVETKWFHGFLHNVTDPDLQLDVSPASGVSRSGSSRHYRPAGLAHFHESDRDHCSATIFSAKTRW